ncbi:MAG: hypothetical protein OXH99_12250 [Bryobacterales bacterium]|nr:hypothetical protein [Bryobacterales bacterium]
MWTPCSLTCTWLVNAPAYEAYIRNKAPSDRSRAVMANAVLEARERLVLRRDTHLDKLVNGLRERPVRRVIEPMLTGSLPVLRDDDIACVRDIGLIARCPPLDIANPIYGEITPRELSSDVREKLPPRPSW